MRKGQPICNKGFELKPFRLILKKSRWEGVTGPKTCKKDDNAAIFTISTKPIPEQLSLPQWSAYFDMVIRRKSIQAHVVFVIPLPKLDEGGTCFGTDYREGYAK